MQLTDPLNSVFFSLLSSGVANQERWFWGEGGNKVTQTLFTMIENSLETVYCSFFSIISCKLRNYVGYPRTKLNNQLDCNGENAYFLWDSSLQYYLTCHMWIYLVPYVDISFANRFSIKCKLILQYTLSQTTVEQLKEPIFNIWHWEPNEVWRKFVIRSLSLRTSQRS